MILITGATGLVGGHLAWHLLQSNSKIVAIKRPTSNLKPLRSIFSVYTDNPDIYLQRIEWRTADILDSESLSRAFEKISKVYHCAAVVDLGSGGEEMIKTNVDGTKNILQAAKAANVESFCFVSSIAACGRAVASEFVTEETPWDSSKGSSYALSKYLSEQEVWMAQREGINVVIVNPGVILGYSGTMSGSSKLFNQVKKGLMFYTLGGSGYVDVVDVVKIMTELVALKIYGERFILVAENCSNKEILSWMADGYNKRKPFVCMNRAMLYSIGFLMEKLGVLFQFKPLLDRRMAITATNREYYSNEKITRRLKWKFNSIQNCIENVCSFDK